MRFWWRELAGWLLIVLGFGFFVLTYEFLREHYVVEVWAFTVIGIFVFRGGIHLLKVAVAARICAQAQQRITPAPVSAKR